MQPWKVIQELEADNSRLKKEAIIKRESDADNIRFFNPGRLAWVSLRRSFCVFAFRNEFRSGNYDARQQREISPNP